MKKWLCISFIMMACLGLSACSDDSSSTKDKDKTAQKEDSKKKVYGIGETAEVKGIRIKVNATRIDDGVYPAKDGKQYFVMDITITNNTKKTFDSSSMLCYTLKDGDGRKMELSIGAKLNGSMDMQVEPGESGTGEIAFEVAPEGKLVLIFSPDAFNNDGVRFQVR